MPTLASVIAALEPKVAQYGQAGRAGGDFHAKLRGHFYDDPVGYAHFIGENPTPDQCDILRHLLIPPFKVLVPSGNSLGKSFCAALAINYWFDCRGPSLVISTAPTAEHVKKVLWTEVRMQRQRAGLPEYFIGPVAPEMRMDLDWYAIGFTASAGESYQGRHRPRMLFIFDEATAIHPQLWMRQRTMFDPRPESGHASLAIFNPLTTNCHAYLEDMNCDEDPDNPPWHRIRLSGLNHPNIAAELAGNPQPIPGAVSLAMIEGWIRDLCEPIERLEDTESTDINFPPGSDKWFRPGPEFQSTCLGLWPTQADGVWSDALWTACDRPLSLPTVFEYPQLGCDTATGKGNDWHAIHGRWGNCSVHHETSNVMDAVKIAARLRDAAKLMAAYANKHLPPQRAPVTGKQVPILIDDDGTGNAIVAILGRDGYNIQGIGAGCSSTKPNQYPRRRDEIWFDAADRAKKHGIDVSRLDKRTKQRLKQQLMAPEFDRDVRGRRCVERKEVTKEKIGRSPDDADAFNLAYHTAKVDIMSAVDPEPQGEQRERGHYAKGRGQRQWT